MSDKSFGDNTNRNTVKNPLLSTAVTGLSIEDLTHNAVLLPAAPSQTLITRPDQQTGPQTHTLAHSYNEPPNFPSGDANLTILSSNSQTDTYCNVLDSKNIVKHEKPNEFTSATISKASVKTEDDFDVNEYFARLQGTRYVSAPLHSHLKEDQNSNLPTEENLEEINLNEADRVQEFQQSITADIAQNFSQLPTVLPQVASAVFSSFSNMLSYKSREQTPDSVKPGYQEVQLRPEDIAVPLMGVEDTTVKEVAPPPKEQSVGGTVSYRITTKKKAYAQIPGLSSGETPQSTYNQPFNQSVPSFFTPLENVPVADINRDENVKCIAQNVAETYNIFNPVAETKAIEMSSEIKPNLAANKNCEAYAPFGVKDHFAPTQDTSIQFVNVPEVVNASAPYGIKENVASTLSQDTNIQLTNIQRSNTAIAPPLAANQFVNVPQGPNAPIIPPPPMFSNITRRDSQPSIGKAILPPSVARRISANHPIIKPQAMPVAFTDNIFVPAPIPDISADQATPMFGQTSASSFQTPPGMQSQTLPSSSFMPIQTSQHTSAFPSSSQPSLFASTNVETSMFAPSHPPASVSSIPFMTPTSVLRPPSFPPTMPQSSIPAPPTIGQSPNISTNIENTPISAFNTVPTSIFTPKNATSEPFIFTTSITEMDPAETAMSTIPMFAATSLPPIAKPQFEPTPPISTNVPLPTSNIGSTSLLLTENVTQTKSTTNLPPPPTFFNPNLMQSLNMDQASQVNQSISKDNIPKIPEPNIHSEPQISSKPLMEPPKASGSLNFRMTKKRPQYYAGPIEGVGAISNNVKPIISTADTNTFQGSVFTPKQEIQPFEPSMIAHNVEAPTPFDISKPVDNVAAYAPFDISKPQEFPPQPEFNTPFDFSRQTTESYEQPKQETKGFGILGSLKSKLSSIDMNKIQSTVTTFFDPAYNEPKTDIAANLDNVPHGTQRVDSYGQPINPTQGQSSFEIFVPNLEQNQQSYSQIYDYKTANNYPLENQYGNAQEQYSYYSRGQNVYPTATSSYYPLYSNTTGSYADIPVNADATSFSASSVTVTPQVVTSSNMGVTSVDNFPQTSTNVSTINTHSDIQLKSNSNPSITASHHTTAYSKENVDSLPQNIDLQSKPQEDVLSSFSQGYIESPPEITEDEAVIQRTVEEKPAINQDITAKSFFEIISAAKEYKSHMNTEDQSSSFNIDLQPTIDMKSRAISKPFEEKYVEDSNVLKGYEKFNTTPLTMDTSIGTSASTDFKFEDKQKSITKIQDFPIIETNLIESLSIDAIPIVAVSSVPLFGLSTIIANTSKDLTSLEYDMKNVSLFDVPQTSLFDQSTSVSFFENIPVETKSLTGDTKNVSELDIYETCREVNKEDLEETDNLTAQLIENITSPIQLSNPVEVPLTESDATVLDRANFDSNQCAEISHMTEETIDTINVQSATELLDDETDMKTAESVNYGWSVEEASYVPSKGLVLDHDYTFQINPDTIGFFGNNSLFFENVPNNASDEIKAEFKNTHDDVLPRQNSIPSAPPAEEDSKSDENGGLDVHSIEQDAKNDFPIDEFVIEPSETDDDKIEFKEREKSSDDPVQDTFTNRVERFKKMEICGDGDEVSETHKNYSLFDLPTKNSPAISIASYFDTGNYAAETHYRNSISSPTTLAGFNVGNPEVPLRIPPGFEDDFKRRLSELSTQDSQQIAELNNRIMFVPDTSTQTKLTYTPTFSNSSDTKPEIVKEIESKLNELVSETPPIFKTDNLPSFSSVFGAETGNKSDDTSDAKPEIVKEIELKLNELVSETPPIFKTDRLPGFSSTFGVKTEKKSGDISPTSAIKIEPPVELVKPTALRDEINFFKPNVPEKQEAIPSLPDPSNFFSSNEPATSGQEAEGLSRLASYFSMPPSKPDHSKSFFELSQSQNHYRHETKDKQKIDSETLNNKFNIPNDTYIANLNLMKDLTSLQNFEVPKDHVVRPVNYFTVEYDMTTEFNNFEPTTYKNGIPEELAESEINDETLDSIINKCIYCCDIKNQMKVYDVLGANQYKFRKVNDNTEPGKNSERKMDQNKDSNRRSVSVDFSNYIQGENHEGATMLNENRPASEYVPVKHHWFYRVDVEDNSIWRGFSVADSKALENAFISSDLNDQTVVATDGGRYDVNIKGRLRIPVYWIEKPTNVRRCSWFYKGTTDARYVPYREEVAIILEEEYRRGITTGEWHRQLVLPDSEMVVMHSPSVMVHFLHSENNDAFSSPPLFTFGKRVYRNPPKITVSHDMVERIDHLLLLVHGAGEYRHQKEKNQSTSRPRVVRRGCDESEIEDPEPSSIDHLLLLCHGVGSACDMRFRNVEEVVEDFRATSLQLLQSHYRNSYDNGTVNRVEVLPISWHETLHSGETGVDRRLAQVTLDSIPRLRNFTNDTVLDVLFYTSPVFCQTILNTVCNELNRIYNLFKKRNPSFNGEVSIGGHSLGSVILYDLLCHQMPMDERDSQCAEKNYVTGSASTGQPTVKYPVLCFSPAAMYALGSPIAIFECIRGVESLGMDFALPTCRNFFNIFHPYDPIAYRIEPLINSQLRDVKPFLIPHHKGRKRMHLELKDTMARVGADLKQKLVESLRATWNKWKAQPPPNDGQLEKVVEEELEKEQLNEDGKDESINTKLATPDMLGKLNDGRRVDYVLQEAPLEMINEYLFAMSSHVGYWESEDTMLLILREIYDAMGVQPDCTVPQQTMTLQRTRLPRQDESMGASDYPSTSHGGT